MRKLAHPISIFILIILGLLLILLKIKISLFLNIQASLIFADGVFFVSLALGLLFFNYLTSESIEQQKKEKIILPEKSKTASKTNTRELKITQEKKEKKVLKVNKKANLEDVSLHLKAEEKEKVQKPKIENAFLPSTIDKNKILKSLSALKANLVLERESYLKTKSKTNFFALFSLLVIVFSVVFFSLNYSTLDHIIISVLITLVLLLVFISLIYKKKSSKLTVSISNISTRLLNLTQVTKRFNAISQKNTAVLKNTVDSLSAENRTYIYKNSIK